MHSMNKAQVLLKINTNKETRAPVKCMCAHGSPAVAGSLAQVSLLSLYRQGASHGTPGQQLYRQSWAQPTILRD